jgi:hypothetical protein
MTTLQRRRILFLAGLGGYLLVLWVLWPTAFLYPLRIFVVFLHELSHALAAIATGGRVDSITLDPREGGLTWVRGGNAFLVLSAGYLGSLLWGLALLAVARSNPKRAPAAVQALGMLTVLVTLVYVRNLFGFVFGLLFGGTLLMVGRRLAADTAVVILTALGLTSALYAVLDIRSDVLSRPTAPSDAAMLAEITGIPALFWGFLWTGIAVVCCVLVLRKLWRRW